MRLIANQPLRHKLLFLMMLTSTVALVIAVGCFSLHEWFSLRDRARLELEARAQGLAHDLAGAVAAGDVERVRNTLESLRAPSLFGAGVFAADGRLLASLTTDRSGPVPELPHTRAAGVAVADDPLAIHQPVLHQGETVGTVYLRSDFASLRAGFRDYLTLGTGVLLGSWIVAFLIAWLLEPVVSGPVMDLVAAAREVKERRDYAVRARGSGRDEIGQLSDAFNELLREIQLRDTALCAARDDLVRRVAERTVELQHEVLERRRIEAALADEKERLAVTLRSIGDAVVATDREGRIVLFNAVAELFTGWSAAAANYQLLSQVLPFADDNPGSAPEDPVLQVLRSGQATELGERALGNARGAAPRRVSSTGAPIRNRDGRLVGVVIVLRDVTEQHRTAQEGLRTSKLESVGLLAGGIAHDFNNILAVILGNVSIARRHTPADGPAVTALLAAEKACIRANDLTRQLLTFSAGGAPVKQTASLAEIIRETVAFALRGSNVALHLALDDDLWPAEIDVGQISQVLHNLALNALHAMPDGGRLTLRGSNVQLEARPGQSLPPGRYVNLTVEDTGRGIPSEQLSRVFDPYFTTRKRGGGLALATAYSIIRKHDGEISVHSEPGQGTVFQIRLPAARGAAPPASEPESVPLHGSERILVMDDEEPIREMVGAMLQSLGYELVTASDGAEAVRSYGQARADGRPFDAVILDLTVPGGMGGCETLQALRALDPRVKAIVSSGYSADPVLALHRDYGFAGMVAKPYRLEDLARTLRSVIQGSPA